MPHLHRHTRARRSDDTMYVLFPPNVIFFSVCLFVLTLPGYRDCNNDVAYNFKKLGHINSMLSLNWFFAFRKFANAYTMHY